MSGEAAALVKLDDWIQRLRTAGESLEESAQNIAGILQEEAEIAVRQQRGMDGYPWPPTKAGTPALVNAPAHIETKARGRVVQMILTGHDVYHHYGAGRVPRRPILPIAGTPAKLGNAIRVGIVDVGVAHLMRGRAKARKAARRSRSR
jgi:hypothetical protein